MTAFTQTYGATSTLAATSLGTLTHSAMTSASLSIAQSASVSNTSAGALDVQVQVSFRSGTAVTNGKAVYVYGVASEDSTRWTQGYTASDVTTTMESPSQAVLLGVVPVGATGTTYVSSVFSLAAAFGRVPRNWGLVFVNDTGAALATATGVPALSYTNITETGT